MSITDFWKSVEAVIAGYKAAASDGTLTMAEWLTLGQKGVIALVQLAELMIGLTGDEKKSLVMEAAGKFYDEVLAPIDIPYVPDILENRVDKLGRQLFLTLADSTVEAIVSVFNKTAWPTPGVGSPAPEDEDPSSFSPY